MKVIEITSRLYGTTTVRITQQAKMPSGNTKYWTIWEGNLNEKEIPNEFLERDVYAIEAIDEDLINLNI